MVLHVSDLTPLLLPHSNLQHLWKGPAPAVVNARRIMLVGIILLIWYLQRRPSVCVVHFMEICGSYIHSFFTDASAPWWLVIFRSKHFIL